MLRAATPDEKQLTELRSLTDWYSWIESARLLAARADERATGRDRRRDRAANMVSKEKGGKGEGLQEELQPIWLAGGGGRAEEPCRHASFARGLSLYRRIIRGQTPSSPAASSCCLSPTTTRPVRGLTPDRCPFVSTSERIGEHADP